MATGTQVDAGDRAALRGVLNGADAHRLAADGDLRERELLDDFVALVDDVEDFVLALGMFPRLGYMRVWGKLTAAWNWRPVGLSPFDRARERLLSRMLIVLTALSAAFVPVLAILTSVW